MNNKSLTPKIGNFYPGFKMFHLIVAQWHGRVSDHVTRVQSEPLAAVPGISASQVNALLPFLQRAWRCRCVASQVCASSLSSKFRCLMGLTAFNKDSIPYSINIIMSFFLPYKGLYRGFCH